MYFFNIGKIKIKSVNFRHKFSSPDNQCAKGFLRLHTFFEYYLQRQLSKDYGEGSKKDTDDESVCTKYYDAHKALDVPRGDMLLRNTGECIHIYKPNMYKSNSFTKCVNQMITFVEMEMSLNACYVRNVCYGFHFCYLIRSDFVLVFHS